MLGSYDFPGASYDAWKTSPRWYEDVLPDQTYFDDDGAGEYYAELEALDELCAFFDTHEPVLHA